MIEIIRLIITIASFYLWFFIAHWIYDVGYRYSCEWIGLPTFMLSGIILLVLNVMMWV